jgi:tetratricopeptide (TPR) repeat protein
MKSALLKQWRISLVCLLGMVFSLLFTCPVSAASDQNASFERGLDLFEAGQYDEAKTIFEPLARDNAEAAYRLGRIYLQEDNVDKSIKWLKKATKLDESKAEYYRWLGNAYGRKAQDASIFSALGVAKNVRKNFEAAVELDPEDVGSRFALVQFYTQAPGIAGGDKDKARFQAEEIKKRDSALGHQAFGVIYQIEEDYEKAEREYRAAVEEEPDSTDVRYALGFFYQQTEQGEKAVETFSSLFKDHPDEWAALYQIGRTGALLGVQLDAAAESLLQYLLSEPAEDDPSLAWAHYRLGMVYEHAELPDSAKIHYRAALKSDPDHKEAKKALKKLK